VLGTTFLSSIGEGPLVATAIHDGHAARFEVRRQFAITEEERLREEDPHTALLTDIAPTRFIGLRSRFEVDLNRPREKAVYLQPEDCWGICLWAEPPSKATITRSLKAYDAFYASVESAIGTILHENGRCIVLDLHSYNHRRGGPDAPPAPQEENPDINIGTGSAPDRWRPVIDGFMERLSAFDYLGRRLDVRENVKFRGGHFPQWIHERFGGAALAIAVEAKKFWMDEWTGAVDFEQLEALRAALQFAAAPLAEERAAS
jgi:hypothetical protein